MVLACDPRKQAAAAWSPPLIGDFRLPDRAGVLRFRDLPTEVVGCGKAVRLSPERADHPPLTKLEHQGLKEHLIRKRALRDKHTTEPARRSWAFAKLESEVRAH